MPLDADLVFDVRFLPNPYYDPALRNQTGLDQEVYDYVMEHKESEVFYSHLTQLIKPILPGYQKKVNLFSLLLLVALVVNTEV